MKKILLYVCCLVFNLPGLAQQQIKETGKPIVETFDQLPSKNGLHTPGEFNSALPDWEFRGYWQDPNEEKEYLANDGTKGTGGITSFGLDGSKNRALGSVAGGQFGELYLAYRLVNKTKSAITSFKLSYEFQQWRQGSSMTPQGFKLAYFKGTKKLKFNPRERLSWRYLPSQFTPVTMHNSGVLDELTGNKPENSIKVSGEFEVDLKPGEVIYIVWIDENSDGYDHGIAIDNLELTPLSDSNKKVLADASAFDFGTTVVGNPVWENLHLTRLSGDGQMSLSVSKSFKLRKNLQDEWVQELKILPGEQALFVAFLPESEGLKSGTLTIQYDGVKREIPLSGLAQKSLNPGDLAILTWNCEEPRNLQFVTLVDIPAGTNLFVTDKSWKGIDKGFSEEENIVAYQFKKDAPAGTIISFKGEDGFLPEKADLHYSPYYETLLFFQGNSRCPHFVLGAGMGEQVKYLFQDRYVEGYVTTVTPQNLSVSNKGIILFGKEDNWQYDIQKYPLQGSKTEILQQLYNLKNWKKSNVKEKQNFEPIKGNISISK